MAGIRVAQYDIFKVGTNKLKYNNWDLTISKQEAFKLNEIIPLFEAQEFRLIAQILNKPIYQIDFSQYICAVIIDKKTDFSRVTSKKGIILNGHNFRRFVGTAGGLKNNTLIFVNTEVIDELNRRCECNRNKQIPLIPAKYETYKALTCSASQQIISPNKILVVKDCVTMFQDDIISLDNSNPEKDSPVMEYLKNVDMENTVSDGFNLCTLEYMTKVSESLGLNYVTTGVCLRNAWLKGMLYAFPIIEFFDTYCGGNYQVTDIWGHAQDIRECEMIITESTLKLWKAYSSIEDYMNAYKTNGYEFAVTKISPNHLDDQRELNYQYLQSYDFTDEDIQALCNPTVEFLKDSMCGDYESTMKFVGITGNEKINTWQKALSISPYMLNDPYIIDSVHRLIKKKINNAKIGKLIVDGNYQIASGDPFALMQSICGLKVTGLLKANECYSKYWYDKGIEEVAVFRSPMTSHNNIRKCRVVRNEEANYWYQYMSTVMIINAWDSFCQSENGCDWDGDILFSTNNKILLEHHRALPPILCAQSNTEKVIVTESAVKKTNKNGMGNQVGTITNRVTAMMEVQSHFAKGTKEYDELSYRIACGQLYQQDEIDKIKGIIAKPMPNYWYSSKAPECKANDFLKSIAIDKKPYFMTYVYDDYRKKHKKYIENCQKKCLRLYGITIADLYQLDNKTEEQLEFLRWYEIKMPFGMGECAMNQICFYIEQQFEGYKSNLKQKSDFDYNLLKVKRRCTEQHRQDLLQLSKDYTACVKKYKAKRIHDKYDSYAQKDSVFIDNSEEIIGNREYLQKYFYDTAKELCSDDDERLNIVLDMCYGYKNNKQFCWDVIGDLICKRLEELSNGTDLNN